MAESDAMTEPPPRRVQPETTARPQPVAPRKEKTEVPLPVRRQATFKASIKHAQHADYAGRITPLRQTSGYEETLAEAPVPEKFSFGDICSCVLSGIAIVPALCVSALALVLLVPPMLGCKAYAVWLRSRHKALARIERDGPFWCCLVPLSVLLSPTTVLTFAWAIVLVSTTLLLSLPVGLCNWTRTKKSCSNLWTMCSLCRGIRDPDAEHYGYFGHWLRSDFFCAFVAAIARKGLWYTISHSAVAIGVVPVLKLAFTNPFLRALDEVVINQWTDGLDADGDGMVNEADAPLLFSAMREIVTAALQQEAAREIVNQWPFQGCHPRPPPERKSKIHAGIQLTSGPWIFVCHTQHPNEDGEGLPPPRSKTAARNVIRLFVPAWNMWYSFSGCVRSSSHFCSGHPSSWLRSLPCFVAGTWRSTSARTSASSTPCTCSWIRTHGLP